MDHVQETLQAAKAGSQEAFEKLYRDTCDRNYYIALKMAGQEQDAMDILQDAYVKIFQKLDTFRYTGDQSFASWTGKVVSNTALDFLRKKRPVFFSEIQEDGGPDFDLEDEAAERQPEMAFDRKETARIVQELLECLSEEQRVCILFRYVRQMKISEIAAELECSENTVKSRLNYAKRRLLSKRETLEKKGVFLRGVAPFTVFVFLLREDVMAAEAPAEAYEAFAETLNRAFHGPDAVACSGGGRNSARLSGNAPKGTGKAAAGAKTAAKSGMVKIAGVAVAVAAVAGAAFASKVFVDYAYDKMADGNSYHKAVAERETESMKNVEETESVAELETEPKTETETAATEEPDMAEVAMEAYKRDVLDEIYYHILDGLGYEAYDPLTNVRSVSEAGYQLIDLDGNGVPELLTSAVEHESSGWFREIYTYADGKAVQLLESRARYAGYLCEGNRIMQENFSSAQIHSWVYYYIDNGELSFEEKVLRDEVRDEENPFFYVPKDSLRGMREDEYRGHYEELDEDKMIRISEEEAEAINNRYTVIPLELTTFDGYEPGRKKK